MMELSVTLTSDRPKNEHTSYSDKPLWTVETIEAHLGSLKDVAKTSFYIKNHFKEPVTAQAQNC